MKDIRWKATAYIHGTLTYTAILQYINNKCSFCPILIKNSK